jgi:hypothetical protein
LTKEQKSRLFFNRNNSRLSQSKQGSAVVVNIDKPRLLSNVRRLKKDYKSATLVLNSFKHYLGQRVSIKKLKRNLSFYKFSKFAFFTKFVFNLNVLLHQLNLFENQKQLFLAVRLDKILKNKIPVGFSSELVKGDVIQVQSPFFFKVGLNENVPFFYSFCEIDLYSNTLVILKDFHELRSNTSNMFIKYLVNISLFVHYLRKK